MRSILICALVSTSLLTACDSGPSGDSSIFQVRSFETGRRQVGEITVENSTYDVFDIDFQYDDRQETRRYVIVGSTRVQCTDEDCQQAVEEYLRNERRGEEDHGY
ncbi:hypothetical protein [Nioella sp.]|uniref:hypothetical protein n=1 Tax=Nioella sp. TaxID=1912091 RepID=UPI003B528E52